MAAAQDATWTVEEGEGGAMRIALSGPLTIRSIGRVAAGLPAPRPSGQVTLDLSEVGRLDTSGAWFLIRYAARARQAGGALSMRGLAPETEALIRDVERAIPEIPDGTGDTHPDIGFVEQTGRGIAEAGAEAAGFLTYLGLFVARLGQSLARPRRFPMTALVHHCEDVGLRAVPIVALLSFLIGVVLAFQGASQLRQFGAEVFVVDLIAVSILRELGILLTAIIVAGRTASSFTAAIGSMKMREEIDAMRTLGIDPAMALFLPRILALILMLPILGLIANVSGLLGGALMSWIELGISPELFRTRLIEGTSIDHLIVGVVKAPVFALIIGVVGCYSGMQVGGNAESLGRQTSTAVVAATFAVIVADALFSIFFAQIGV